jgi:hypothetical protein
VAAAAFDPKQFDLAAVNEMLSFILLVGCAEPPGGTGCRVL